jgi:hypothetical protein
MRCRFRPPCSCCPCPHCDCFFETGHCCGCEIPPELSDCYSVLLDGPDPDLPADSISKTVKLAIQYALGGKNEET